MEKTIIRSWSTTGQRSVLLLVSDVVVFLVMNLTVCSFEQMNPDSL